MAITTRSNKENERQMKETILHRFICPDCDRPFLLNCTKEDIEELAPKFEKDSIIFSQYVCRECGL